MDNSAKRRLRANRGGLLLVIVAIALVGTVSLLKYRDDDVNYYNSDATWHALLTIEAYDETPVSDHLFLPIVTLGSPNDKGITWGGTIPDHKGNYYYTSFSPAGYFLPWLFLKIFGLPVAEGSLYIFNSILFAASAALWALFIYSLHRESECAWLLSWVALVCYVLAPELLHGMGIVYWHQSVLQVTLIAQIFAYHRMVDGNSRTARAVFYLLALLNPYIEWTGYVANVGFALAELLRYWRVDRNAAIKQVVRLGLITFCSFALFSFHYVLVVSPKRFLRALKNRFFARNFSGDTPWSSLLLGYLSSFRFLWGVLLILGIWMIVRKRRIVLKHGIMLLVVSFPVLENLVMKEHAIRYSYDRMKLILPLVFVICEIVRAIWEGDAGRKRRVIAVVALVMLGGGLNFWSYTGDTSYVWSIDYQTENEKLAEFIEREYPDSTMTCDEFNVRGYMNLLFHRGIYGVIPPELTKELAEKRGTRYGVTLIVEDQESWNMFKLGGATVCDLSTGEEWKIVKGADGEWVRE